MAIFGAGSKWDDEELSSDFFKDSKYTIGWNNENASDLYNSIAALKAGDIIYLKSNQPGSREIKVKGIGFVTKNFISCLTTDEFKDENIKNYESLSIKVNWIITKKFTIEIPEEMGKLTNIRAATFYEEYLPYVQDAILGAIFRKLKP